MKHVIITPKFFKLFLVFLIGVQSLAWCQDTYKQSKDSYITVAGTSTLHEWTMTTHEPLTQVAFEMANGTIASVKNLNVTITCQTLKSAHAAMDKNAYSSLKVDKFKTIVFKLTSATVQNNAIQCTGTLTIAGVTKTISFASNFEVKPESIHVTGNVPIKMSDYQVEAPSFMFGTVKTGNEITVSFNLQLVKV
jgi:polyisoprenoid-binding protein YceI